MSLLTKMLKERCVYWACTGSNDFNEPAYAAPVEVRCRWEDGTEEFLDATTGQRVLSTAKVYVGQDVAVRGKLALGTLQQLGTPASPTAAAREIRSFGKLPNLKCNKHLRTAMLV